MPSMRVGRNVPRDLPRPNKILENGRLICMETTGIEIFLIHPHELSDYDWLEIGKKAVKHAERGEKNYIKCCVLAFVEFLDIEEIELKRH